jgi:hypothetical protein
MFRRLAIPFIGLILAFSQTACAQQSAEQWWPWPVGDNAAKNAVAQKLPELHLDSKSVTVSGISAGAFMATQLHIAYSASIMGSGSVAGGPWGCSGGSVWQAQSRCMNSTTSIDTEDLAETLRSSAKAKEIDDLSNLKSARLYLFNSETDGVVRPPMRQKNVEFFSKFIPRESIQVEEELRSAHGFPTIDYGVECGQANSPYLMKCNFDTAGEIFKQLYAKTPGVKLARVPAVKESLFVIDQSEFNDPNSMLADSAWMYVPKACLKVGSNCRLHVALHGCLQSGEAIKDVFAVHAGYNEWAEGSNIVVLYPQAQKSLISNPNGCFDWFGYTGSDYAVKSGPQMRTIKAMIDHLVSP